MTKEELLKKIDFEKNWLYECGIFGSDVDIAFHAIKNSVIKALEQEPKTGHWITWKEAGNEIPSETRFECSVCHDAAHTLCNGLDLLSSYCPNCGARMEGGAE